ncbi:putative membrane protein [Catalinimonas alkaloidigena]|uniref:DUF502 domain-containing protein n=1 Tax=Catalinimonas alkaloidigena TaxID=1075417 RepID=UPI0024073C82|nr:DUF502 domain-containing protein [Catalinimonas alkaloidigena]MDF9795275.1 putative membrane protein [Catalinimonas alkaloidigena]
MNRFVSYFFRGLLFVVPVALTMYIIILAISWLDSLIPFAVPGLGMLTILVFITLIGYLASTLLAGPIFKLLEELLVKVPLINIIYSSLKDLISAFVGDKKKFNQPVLVTLNPEFVIQKPGFITQKDLSQLGLVDQVAVYLPHSYNFSGNLYIVPAKFVVPIKAASSADIMKFIVSGGVSGLQEVENQTDEGDRPGLH